MLVRQTQKRSRGEPWKLCSQTDYLSVRFRLLQPLAEALSSMVVHTVGVDDVSVFDDVQAEERKAADLYAQRGFQSRVGYGKRPAVIVVDFTVEWCDPAARLGADHSRQLKNTKTLLDVARNKKNIPIIFTTIAYDPDMKDAGLWIKKVPALADAVINSKGCEIHPSLEVRDNELVLTKKYSSAFFGTPLLTYLNSRTIDTTIITGCSTSACIRHTTVDALGNGFRPILPRECIGDRAPGPHEWNLFDIDAKFGDVVPLEEVIQYLSNLSV